ncbi:maltokinase N-terminal cap-like domain-containing protein [Microlunatus speluncae]|uniref:maltokinase N-terminal cap-like domain-containing protein n=1 Tax=Microlunatus speluncae TaxID=2594267 RepID=UPI0012666A7C|nr:phosphotransferase [Microlunatus speluncae]
MTGSEVPAAGSDGAGSDGSLLPFLESSRWFAGKGRSATLRSLTPLPWLRPPGEWPAVRIEIVEVGYPDTHAEYYQLPLAYRPAAESPDRSELRRIEVDDHGTLAGFDATDDPDASSVILVSLLTGAPVAADDHELEFVPEPAVTGLPADLPPSRLTGEQSNTSIRYGDRALLKLFRRLELGDNLDITVHRALNEADATDAARLYGKITATWPLRGTALRADLGMLTELFSDAEDGWRLAVEAAESTTDFTDGARRLGAALAGVHQVLRSAFPTGTRSGEEIAAGMTDRLQRTVEFAPQLHDHADAIRARFDRLSGLTLDTQRVHGDFHLGQTLRTSAGWKIIDFEGEPAKTMAERLLPDSRWRDVAGMLRSFDYAVADSPEAADDDWAGAAQAAFIEGYAAADPPTEVDRMIIDAYVADKAIYELGYEVRNRPDWVRIPLDAIIRLASDKQRTNEDQEVAGKDDHD